MMNQIQERLKGMEMRADIRAKEVDMNIDKAQRKTDNLLNEIMRQAQDCNQQVAYMDAKVDTLYKDVTRIVGDTNISVDSLRG